MDGWDMTGYTSTMIQLLPKFSLESLAFYYCIWIATIMLSEIVQ